MLTPPIITEVDGFLIVRDDLVEGGTKRRVIGRLLSKGGEGLLDPDKYSEFVYASPAFGYAQVALAHACRESGVRATVFTALRSEKHVRALEAEAAGAKIVMVPMGFLSNVHAKARRYAEAVGAKLLPFGLDCPEMRDGLTEVAESLKIKPKEVWTVVGSGTLTRSLQKAWPRANFCAVRVGCKTSDVGRATVYTAPEKFPQDAKVPPPFPSCSNYDAKAWRFITEHASPGALFWNVAK